MAGLTGLEPATSGVTGRRSNQTELQPLIFSRRRKGKSCFYFKKPTEVTAELDQLLKKGYDSFQQKNWL